jgi:serine/threonine protein kinase
LSSRAPPLKEPNLEPVAESAAGTPGFERRVVLRHDGLLARLANARIRAALASPLGDGAVDQVHCGTPLPIGTRLGDFVVTGVVHQGSLGVVYAGEDRSLERKIAIREYLPDRLAARMADGNVGVRSLRHQQSFRDGKERFISEARMLEALDEPALVKVLRFWEQHGTAYMAMPLYEGQTLNDVLRDSPKPREAWLKVMLGPLLDALAALHRSEFYPCDVTPDNIVVLDDGTPLLFAVGAGRIVANSLGDFRLDPNQGFAPIEQFARDPTMPEGPWTDIYAVAAVLHFAITGKPPPAPTARMLSDTLPPLRDANRDYSALFLDAVDRGLAVHPRHRPQTIAEFREALGIPSITSGVMPTARPGPSSPAPSTAGQTASLLQEPGPIPRVGMLEGSQMDAPGAAPGAAPEVTSPSSSVPEQTSPTLSSQATIESSLGRARWKLVVPLIVVGSVALGLLVWAVGEPRHSAPGTVDRALSMPPIPIGAQPSPPVATPAVPTQSVLGPVAANPPVADLTPHKGAVPDAGTVAPIPGRRTTPGASAPPAARTGKIRFSIKPWGEIMVDGKTRGVSPPIKELSIPEGHHRVAIRNGRFPGYESELDIKAGSRSSISYSFKAP